MNELFRKFASNAAVVLGSPPAFVAAIAIIITWAAIGPLLHFSDAWQLIINSCSSIFTFLMVFLLQQTQNRDTKAIQLKLDELIRAMENARTEILTIEEKSDEELDQLEDEFHRIGKHAEKKRVEQDEHHGL